MQCCQGIPTDLLIRLLSYQLADETGKQVSSRTVRRRLSETGVNARRPRKNPLLTENHRRLRLGWATTRTQWTLDDWKSVLFTDESKVSIGNDGALYVWRRKVRNFSLNVVIVRSGTRLV